MALTILIEVGEGRGRAHGVDRGAKGVEIVDVVEQPVAVAQDVLAGAEQVLGLVDWASTEARPKLGCDGGS